MTIILKSRLTNLYDSDIEGTARVTVIVPGQSIKWFNEIAFKAIATYSFVPNSLPDPTPKIPEVAIAQFALAAIAYTVTSILVGKCLVP